MTVTVFILLVVLYTLACVADGPDIKPIWQTWLNYPKLYAEAQDEINSLQLKLSLKPIPIEQTTFIADKIEKHVLIDEWQIAECMRHEQMAKERKLFIPRQYRLDYLIQEGVEHCKQEIFKEIEGRDLLSIRVDKESHWPDIVVSGFIHVGKKQENR